MGKTDGVNKPRTEPKRLNWRDAATIIGSVVLLSGVTMSVVGWIHAEVTIPKILNQTSVQIKEALEHHSKFPHPVSASRHEFNLLRDSIEESIDDFKLDSRQRLMRIETKLDSM